MSKNKFYPDEDINDLIESEEEAFFKGGPGSGIKGHRTVRDYNFHQRMQPGGGGLDKKRGALKHFDQMYRDAKANNDPEAMEHYSKLRAEAHRAVIGQMSPSEKDAKIKENDAKIQSMKKPNPGT